MKSLALGPPSREQTRLRTLFVWGIELRFWVASCVSALALFVQQALQFAEEAREQASTYSPSHQQSHVIYVIFFSTLALYNLDGTLDRPRGTLGGAPYRHVHLRLTLLSFAMLAGAAPSLSPAAFSALFFGFGFSALYAVPLTLLKNRPSLKTLPGFKGPFVGVAVASAVVWLPSLNGGVLNNGALMPLKCLFFVVLTLCCTTNALLFDMPDFEQDQRARVPTLVVALGPTATRKVCVTLAAISFFLWLGGLWLLGTLGLPTLSFQVNHQNWVIVALCSLPLSLLAASTLVGLHSSRAQVAWMVDGALLLPLALLSLAIL